MEFYHNGKKNTTTTATQQVSELDVEPEPEQVIEQEGIQIQHQKSWIHIWGTVYVARKFLQSKGIEINEKWSNCPEWVNDYNKVSEYIERCCASGILEIRAADTLEPIIDWLKSNDWTLDGIEQLTVAPSSVLVAMRSHLNYGSHMIQSEFKMTTISRKFNGRSMRALNIENAIIGIDKFDNNYGLYRYHDEKQGITTIRLTRLENGDPEEVMLNHLTDEGMTTNKDYKGISFLPINKKLTTEAMRDLNGATNGDYQVTMVAADGVLQIDHQKFNYDMKSLALIVYRGGERNVSPDGYYMFYNVDASGNAYLKHPVLIEIIHDKTNMISAVINPEDIGCSD
jgi:hypothetical protein